MAQRLSITNISQLFGGGKTLRFQLKDLLDFDELIKKGIPFTAADYLKKKLKLTDTEFARAIGISTRTLNRQRKSQDRLSLIASDRLFRLARIFSFAVNVLEDEDIAAEWIHNPQTGLGGRVPLDMIRTYPGAKEVEDLLGRIEYGVLS